MFDESALSWYAAEEEHVDEIINEDDSIISQKLRYADGVSYLARRSARIRARESIRMSNPPKELDDYIDDDDSGVHDLWSNLQYLLNEEDNDVYNE